VGWDNMLKRHQLSHSRFKPFKRRTSGVRFIAFYNCTPLTGAHAAGARVGEQIDNHILRIEFKHIVISRFDKGFALGAGSHFDGFNRFNAEWFDDCLHCKNFDAKLKNPIGLKHDERQKSRRLFGAVGYKLESTENGFIAIERC
jgi:hypothetical protein